MIDPRELPSGRSAIEFAEGKPGAPLKLAVHTALRAGLIGAGMYVVGGDRGARLWVRGLGASVAIEVFVLAWVFAHNSPAPKETRGLWF